MLCVMLTYEIRMNGMVSYLGRVNKLISQTLCNRLDVSECGLAGSGAQQPDSLVHPPQGRHIDGLTPYGTGTSYTCGVLTGSTVDTGVHNNFQWVLEIE